MQTLKVLIPTDFSIQAEFAFLLGQNLGRSIPFSIHFLHVLEVPDTVTLAADGTITTCGEIDVSYVKTQKEMAERKLGQLKTQYGGGIETHLAFGKLTDTVVSFATDNNYDLIMMGTKGATGLKEKLAGSETQMIARKSPVPLLSLMCDRNDLEIRDILITHDFSGRESINLPLLKLFIEAFQPKFHLLQIVNAKTNKTETQENMRQFAEQQGLLNFELYLLPDTDVEHGVTHFTQMHNIDLVCIGTHGSAGFWRNSATEKLINHLFKPMISFRIS